MKIINYGIMFLLPITLISGIYGAWLTIYYWNTQDVLMQLLSCIALTLAVLSLTMVLAGLYYEYKNINDDKPHVNS